jgi:hypothetical protein
VVFSSLLELAFSRARTLALLLSMAAALLSAPDVARALSADEIWLSRA